MLQEYFQQKISFQRLIFTGVLLSFLAISFKFIDFNFFQKIRLIVFDQYQKLFTLEYEESPIAIVNIDERSLEAYGQFPWPRTYLSQIIQELKDSGALAVGIDILLPEPDRTSLNTIAEQYELDKDKFKEFYFQLSNDLKLSNTIRTTNVFTGFSAGHHKMLKMPKRKFEISSDQFNSNYLYDFENALVNLPVIDQNTRGVGSLNYVRGIDGIIRSIPLIIKINGELWPNLELEMLRALQGMKSYKLTTTSLTDAEILTGDFSVPVTHRGEMIIRFKNYLDKQHLSAKDILEKNYNINHIKNKIVYIGSSAVGLFDIFATPTTPLMTGVEVRANVIENIINQNFLTRPLWVYILESILILLTVTLTFTSLFKIKNVITLSAFFGSQILFVLIGFYSFYYHSILFDYSYIVITSMIVLAFGLYLTTMRGRYLSTQERLKREKITKEVEFAGEIQSFLIPQTHPNPETIIGVNIPARQVSGDYFDYIDIDDDRTLFTLADVSGKGAGSGLLMSKSSAVFRVLAQNYSTLPDLVLKLNREVCDRAAKGMFITMVIGLFHRKNKTIDIINAGHEPVVQFMNDKTVNTYPSNFRPIGIMHLGLDEELAPIRIKEGPSRTFIYTDGVTEGYLNDEKEELTAKGVENIVFDHFQANLKSILDVLVEKLTQSTIPRRDDITCLGIKVE